MAKQHIYIQISTADTIEPESLVAAIRDAYAVLRELDASISQNPRGVVHWEIETIKKASPLVFSFVGRSKGDGNPVPVIQKQLMGGLKALSGTKGRPVEYSDRLLTALHRFGKLQERRDLGHINVYISTRAAKVGISERFLKSIEALLGPAYESSGSIIGSLDSITVHRGNEFRVWDEVFNKPVTCVFDREQLPMVKENLKRRVLVSGDVKRNIQGVPIKIRVKEIEPQKSDSELPTIQEMSGLVDDFTDGMSINDYIEEIRGDR